MKKKIFMSIAAVAVVAVAAVNVSYALQENDLSDLALANVEMLAYGEGTSVTGCLGLWGSCTTASGAVSKAPLVEANF